MKSLLTPTESIEVDSRYFGKFEAVCSGPGFVCTCSDIHCKDVCYRPHMLSASAVHSPFICRVLQK